ncbi:ring canal kelch protein [Danaus plexippus plexippus]|uniref:Ring canal kelch protein n=1 Tax=Danaus plexippus plexippus TaxID=278856 RepID=A0A212FJC6_DANPL|nr:ring canal kelch protein [Danaus plexippus plexippus]
MPPKKSNLNNASSKGSRRKRVERAQQLPEQIETRNAAQRIRTAESRAQESQEQRDERLQQNITYIISIIYNIREQERHENET